MESDHFREQVGRSAFWLRSAKLAFAEKELERDPTVDSRALLSQAGGQEDLNEQRETGKGWLSALSVSGKIR